MKSLTSCPFKYCLPVGILIAAIVVLYIVAILYSCAPAAWIATGLVLFYPVILIARVAWSQVKSCCCCSCSHCGCTTGSQKTCCGKADKKTFSSRVDSGSANDKS